MGLAPYTGETRRFFFGRDAEIADIFVRVREQPLTILYGQSGLGKSSLLRAGLEPKLLVEGWRPVVTRLRFDDLASPLTVQLTEALDQAIGSASGESPAMTIWERLHHRASRPDDLESRPPVLIFDQFEEIFTLGARAGRQEEVAAFFQELAQAVENRPPAALQEAFESDRRLARDYDFSPGGIRFVLTLREDYLFGLDEWKKELPSLMRNRAPLRLLNGPQALEAVVRPGALDGPPLVSPGVAANIVCFVADKPSGTPLDSIGAVPPLLSLVCERLNDDRIRRDETAITAEQVASQSGSILDQFYEESFAGHPLALRHFVEDELVTERGHRAPFSREDAEDRLRREGLQDPATALENLLAHRLITAEERAGIPWIEITHDVLAPLVVRSRDERFERERADAEQRRAEAIEIERRKLRRIGAAFVVLAVLAVAGMVFGWSKEQEAQKERDKALETATRLNEAYYKIFAWVKWDSDIPLAGAEPILQDMLKHFETNSNGSDSLQNAYHSAALTRFGDLYLTLDKNLEALSLFEKAVAISREALDYDPGDNAAAQNFTTLLNRVTMARRELAVGLTGDDRDEQYEEALKVSAESIEFSLRQAERPGISLDDAAYWDHLVGAAYIHEGETYNQRAKPGDHQAAVVSFSNAIDAYESAKKGPGPLVDAKLVEAMNGEIERLKTFIASNPN
jgi:tetratricopeptide (TPR) repeat protein